MNAAEVKTALMDLLLQHEKTLGKGPDAYCQEPQDHPMADAKFLLAIAQSYKAGILSESRYRTLRDPALNRLRLRMLEISEGGGAWGLGFAWEALECDQFEPFLITSAVVCRSLIMSDNAVPLDDAGDILEQAITGLDWWSETQTAPVSKGIRLPVYSLNQFRKPIYNAAGYSLGTLQLVKKNAAYKKSLHFVMEAAVDSFGWVYSADNNVIDLLHQWYIINSLIDTFGVTEASRNALGVIGQFSTPDGYIDTMKILAQSPNDDEDELLFYRALFDKTLAIKPHAARIWSLGEMLVGVSRIARAKENSLLWKKYAFHVAEALNQELQNESNVENRFPRHLMHAAHGMAAYLAYKRNAVVS